jgi:hypothetical protein
MGGMIETDLYCFAGLVYAAFVCLSSMTVFLWLDAKPGWETVAAILVIMWIGLSMSVVAWMKVWMASPSFNVGQQKIIFLRPLLTYRIACSITSIIIFVVYVVLH